MFEHTPEPWECEPHSHGSGPGTKYDWTILGGTYLDYHEDDEQPDDPTIEPSKVSTVVAKALGNATSGVITEANARRIVACVNACAGLNPEAVPDLISAVIGMAERIDEYVSELRLDGMRGEANNVEMISNTLKAAIAKAEGRTQ